MVNGKLHAFYAADSNVDKAALTAFVQQHLPFYSVPEKWVYVAEIPLTPNGKVDKKMLTALAVSTAAEPDMKPSLPITTTILVEEVPAHLEKTERSDSAIVRTSLSILKEGIASVKESFESESDALPAKNGFHGQRWLRHRAFILYRRFFSVIMLANIAAACLILYRRAKQNRYILADVSTAFAANLCMTVLMRSEPVVNLLFTVACSVPTSWPLAIRRQCARIFHIGMLACILSLVPKSDFVSIQVAFTAVAQLLPLVGLQSSLLVPA